MSQRRRLVSLVLTALALLAVAAGAAMAADHPLGPYAHPHGPIKGVIPSYPAQTGVSAAASAGNLRYHGGPVMHANQTFAIYWDPGGDPKLMDPGYVSTINGFFGNVAAASGRHSNVYFSDTQYFDTSGAIRYRSHFAASAVDTRPLPRSACPARGRRFTRACITDAQAEAEIERVMRSKGWSPGIDKVYFLFTLKGTGSCVDRSLCAYTYYCGYHSYFSTGGGPVVYGLIPYPLANGRCDDGAQRGLTPEHPNGSIADSTINAASHEHNEAITDPLGDGWWDDAGDENGDKCLYRFGKSLGSTHSGLYNQRIGRGVYWLQGEWSNARRGCVLKGR